MFILRNVHNEIEHESNYVEQYMNVLIEKCVANKSQFYPDKQNGNNSGVSGHEDN